MASLIPAEVIQQALERQRQINVVPTGLGQVLPPAGPRPRIMPGMDNPAMRLQTAAAMGRGATGMPQAGPGNMGPMAASLTKYKQAALAALATGLDEDQQKQARELAMDPNINPQQFNQLLQFHAHQQTQKATAEREAKGAAALADREKAAHAEREAAGKRTEAHATFNENKDVLAGLEKQEASFLKEHQRFVHQKDSSDPKVRAQVDPNEAKDFNALKEQESNVRQRMQGLVTPQPPKPGHPIDQQNAMHFMQAAGGDRNKARQLAKQAGWSF